MDPSTQRLLDGPIAPTLLRLAAPNVVMLVAQVAISILEAYYVGWLGADALAGVSVTFPLVMLSRAVVVTMIGRLSSLAALARPTTLCFSSPVEMSRTPVMRPT